MTKYQIYKKQPVTFRWENKEAAANFLRKDERVTLRISSGDLARLKQKAAYKGLPY